MSQIKIKESKKRCYPTKGNMVVDQASSETAFDAQPPPQERKVSQAEHHEQQIALGKRVKEMGPSFNIAVK